MILTTGEVCEMRLVTNLEEIKQNTEVLGSGEMGHSESGKKGHFLVG